MQSTQVSYGQNAPVATSSEAIDETNPTIDSRPVEAPRSDVQAGGDTVAPSRDEPRKGPMGALELEGVQRFVTTAPVNEAATTWEITWAPSVSEPKRGQLGTMDWPDLLRFVKQPLEGAVSKDGLPVWNPAVFARNHRLKDGIGRCTMLVFDIDADAKVPTFANTNAILFYNTLDKLFARFRFAIHSTFSSTVELYRWRVVLPLFEPVSREVAEAAWRWTSRKLAGVGIVADKNGASQALASKVPARPPHGGYVAGSTKDRAGLLDATHYAEREKAYQKKQPLPLVRYTAPANDFRGRQAPNVARARAYLVNCPPAIEGQRGHDLAIPAASKVASKIQGITVDELVEAMDEWNARCVPPFTLKELRHKATDGIKNAWGR